MTNEAFANNLGIAVRTVAKWNADPELVPPSEFQRMLDTKLGQASDEEKARFELLVERGEPTDSAVPEINIPMPRADQDGGAIGLRLSHDAAVNDALLWLDENTQCSGTARQRVMSQLRMFTLDSMAAEARRRGKISRADTAKALMKYYGPSLGTEYRFYEASCSDNRHITSIVTKREWLDLGLALGAGKDRVAFTAETALPKKCLPEIATDGAVRRLAEILATGARMINAPLYRLTSINVAPHGISGSLGLIHFVDYALTLDLLENELIDSLSVGGTGTPQDLPLRSYYLPTTSSLVDLNSRICAGGPLALFAIARSRRSRKGASPDYALLIQERSGRVLNSARRLAVIPKAFHQPLVDFSDEAQLSATLERELEEELFGRPEVDSTLGEQRLADPMHEESLSAPMRWLMENAKQGTWRIECVGFGINSMTGCFEAPCLIVIDDETWWDRFGGSIQANWETEGLRRYSSLDQGIITELINDPAWSNEGLFAFLQGLRRLGKIGGQRVNLPSIGLKLDG